MQMLLGTKISRRRHEAHDDWFVIARARPSRVCSACCAHAYADRNARPADGDACAANGEADGYTTDYGDSASYRNACPYLYASSDRDVHSRPHGDCNAHAATNSHQHAGDGDLRYL